MAGGVEILHLAVVCPLVGHVEGGRDGTAVRVLSSLLEQVGIQALVQVVHGIVEGQEYDLWYLLRQVVTCSFRDRDSECDSRGVGWRKWEEGDQGGERAVGEKQEKRERKTRKEIMENARSFKRSSSKRVPRIGP